MRMGTICIGLAICSLAGISGLAQEADVQPVPEVSASVSATAEVETDVTVEENGKGKRKTRIARRLPGGEVEVEEFSEDVFTPPKPKLRRRVEVIEDDEADGERTYERRIEVRPQIRVFPKERELVIRRGAGERDMRIELDVDAPGAPPLRKELRTSVRRFGGGNEPENPDAPMEHLEEAIRHLKRARMPEMAERLEAELRELRARRNEGGAEGLNEQLRSLREERDALKNELRKLREQIQKLDRSGGTKKEETERE